MTNSRVLLVALLEPSTTRAVRTSIHGLSTLPSSSRAFSRSWTATERVHRKIITRNLCTKSGPNLRWQILTLHWVRKSLRVPSIKMDKLLPWDMPTFSRISLPHNNTTLLSRVGLLRHSSPSIKKWLILRWWWIRTVVHPSSSRQHTSFIPHKLRLKRLHLSSLLGLHLVIFLLTAVQPKIGLTLQENLCHILRPQSARFQLSQL